MIPRNSRMIGDLVDKLEDFIVVIFMPIYFTNSGLRTEIGTLNDAESWGIVLLVFVVAFVTKTIGCGVPGKYIGGLSNKEALCFGILMQTKGKDRLSPDRLRPRRPHRVQPGAGVQRDLQEALRGQRDHGCREHPQHDSFGGVDLPSEEDAAERSPRQG